MKPLAWLAFIVLMLVVAAGWVLIGFFVAMPVALWPEPTATVVWIIVAGAGFIFTLRRFFDW